MEQKDPLTGEIFYPGRTNQRFSSRENQIRYNNLKAYEKRKAKADIDRKFDYNRTILKKILGNKQHETRSVDFLLGAGFDFYSITHYRVKDNVKQNCVYEFAFIVNKDKTIKIFKHE